MTKTLDKRIKDPTKIFNCFSTEEAMAYLGKTGYFADRFSDFEFVTKCCFQILDDVKDQSEPFRDGFGYVYRQFFLPAEFVEGHESSKKNELRPYTKEEFLKKFGMGRPIRYRRKDDPKSERRSIFIGYYVYAVDRSDDDLYEEKILIGLCDYTLDGLLNYYTLDSLFNDYEFFSYVSVKWCPFGTENNKEAARVIFTSIPRGCSKSLFCDLDLKEVDVEKNNEE